MINILIICCGLLLLYFASFCFLYDCFNTSSSINHDDKIIMANIFSALKILGFEDITDLEPIHFSEQLPVTFDNIYSIQKRFKRIRGDLTTYILIGRNDFNHNILDVIIHSAFGDCYRNFSDQIHKEYFTTKIIDIIQFCEQFVKDNYILSHNVK